MKPKVPDFDELLASATRSALHLEMRDMYGVAEEEEEFRLWSSGKWTLDDGRKSLRNWMDLVSNTVARGVSVRRARVVSMPATTYIRYEHAVTPLNLEAGEDVRWLPRREALGIPLPANDFWLIDGRTVRFNHFSGDGAAVEPEISVDPPVTSLCESAFEAVWERATPHAEFRV